MSIRGESTTLVTANSQAARKKTAPWQDRTADLGISALSNSHMCRYETHVITNYTKEAFSGKPQTLEAGAYTKR